MSKARADVSPPRRAGSSKVDARVARLEEQVERLEEHIAVLAWVHTELSYAIRMAAATRMAQQLQPQIQQALMARLMGAAQGKESP